MLCTDECCQLQQLCSHRYCVTVLCIYIYILYIIYYRLYNSSDDNLPGQRWAKTQQLDLVPFHYHREAMMAIALSSCCDRCNLMVSRLQAKATGPCLVLTNAASSRSCCHVFIPSGLIGCHLMAANAFHLGVARRLPGFSSTDYPPIYMR